MPEVDWHSPEVKQLRQRGDWEGIRQLVVDGRLELSRHNPYRDRIPVDSSPASSPSGEGGDHSGGPGDAMLTRPDVDRLRREGRHDEL
jgi:hypothetical protein